MGSLRKQLTPPSERVSFRQKKMVRRFHSALRLNTAMDLRHGLFASARPTNRRTRARVACFVTNLVRRRVLCFATPRQLNRLVYSIDAGSMLWCKTKMVIHGRV